MAPWLMGRLVDLCDRGLCVPQKQQLHLAVEMKLVLEMLSDQTA
jgi:hypothetical protein